MCLKVNVFNILDMFGGVFAGGVRVFVRGGMWVFGEA